MVAIVLTPQQAAAVREALEHTRKMMQKNRDESAPASESETSLSEVIRMLGGC